MESYGCCAQPRFGPGAAEDETLYEQGRIRHITPYTNKTPGYPHNNDGLTMFESNGTSYCFNTGAWQIDNITIPMDVDPQYHLFVHDWGLWGRNADSVPDPTKLVMVNEWSFYWLISQEWPGAAPPLLELLTNVRRGFVNTGPVFRFRFAISVGNFPCGYPRHADDTRPEDDDAQAVGALELSAHLLLEPFSYPVKVPLFATDLRGQEYTVRMLDHTRAHLHHASELASTGRLKDVPQPLYVDEEGLDVVLGWVVIPEVGRQIHDTFHTIQGAIDGVEIGDIAIDLVPCPIPVVLSVHLPRFRLVVEGAHLVAPGEVLQHRPADPSGGTNDSYFHN